MCGIIRYNQFGGVPMTKQDQLQAMLAKLISDHGEEYGIKLERSEVDDCSIDVRIKGQLVTIQIN